MTKIHELEDILRTKFVRSVCVTATEKYFLFLVERGKLYF